MQNEFALVAISVVRRKRTGARIDKTAVIITIMDLAVELCLPVAATSKPHCNVLTLNLRPISSIIDPVRFRSVSSLHGLHNAGWFFSGIWAFYHNEAHRLR
jgi:hypothetical protein